VLTETPDSTQFTPQELLPIFVIICCDAISFIVNFNSYLGSYLLFGIILDKVGPLKTAIIGASMSGCGILLLGFATEYSALICRVTACQSLTVSI
jgi:hypothetical protein